MLTKYVVMYLTNVTINRTGIHIYHTIGGSEIVVNVALVFEE